MKQVIATPTAPAAIGPYSPAIRAGSLLFVSGQIPLDPATGQLVSTDIAAETRRVLSAQQIQNRIQNPKFKLIWVLPAAIAIAVMSSKATLQRPWLC